MDNCTLGKHTQCAGAGCEACGWDKAEIVRREQIRRRNGLTRNSDGLYRLILPPPEPIITPPLTLPEKRKLPKRTCTVCGAVFQPKYQRHTYCSDQCRKKKENALFRQKTKDREETEHGEVTQ